MKLMLHEKMSNWSVKAMALFQGFVRKFLHIYWISWKASAVPFQAIGNARDQEERDQLVKNWKDAMMYQLSNVELIGAIFLAVIVGGFTWPMLADISTTTIAILQALWFSSLIIAIAAVAVAVHQSVFLARLATVPNYQAILVEILCYEHPNGDRVPRRDQTFIWLLAVALLEWSMCFWLGGYSVFIWDITKMRRKDQSSLDIMIVTISATALLISTLMYLFSVTTLWTKLSKSKALLKIK